MKGKRAKLSDQIRRAVDAAGASRYQICEAAGLDKATMSRFMAGRVGLSLPTVDALAAVLGLRIVTDGPANVRPSRRPGRKAKPKERHR